MKKLTEVAGIKNMNTDETTIIDDEGNINELEPGEESPFDFFAGIEDEFGGEEDGGWNLDNPFGDAEGGDMEGLDFEGEGDPALDAPLEGGEEEGLGDEMNPDDELGLGEEETDEDPNFQGVIRTVTGACLVYKRKGEEGTYEELWVYGIGKNMRNEAKIRRAILAGTDIGIQDVSSEDGTQECVTTNIGNVQYLKIMGLPN